MQTRHIISLVRLFAVGLLLGTALVAVGAGMHPMLGGDAAAQLRIIATTPYWRAIHLVMLCGTGLVIVGIWTRLLVAHSGAPAPLLVSALAVITIGEAINALNIVYMASVGTHLAERFKAGDGAAAAFYDATHPIGLTAARFGNYLIALGAVPLGWAEWQDALTPRLFAMLAWLAASAGLVGVLFFDETSQFTLAAVAILSAWQVAIGASALHRPRQVQAP